MLVIYYIGSTVFHKTPGFTQLFYNTDNSTLTLNGNVIVIEGNIIIGKYHSFFYFKKFLTTSKKTLFYSKGAINIGADKTNILSINNK